MKALPLLLFTLAVFSQDALREAGVRTGVLAPRVEVLGPRLVALRLNPQLVHDRHANVQASRGRVFATGTTEFNYRLPVPLWLERARPEKLEFIAEIAPRVQAAAWKSH